MKNKAIVLILGLILSLSSFAKKIYQDGVFYLNNGDSVECSIRVYSENTLLGIGKLQYIEDNIKKKISFNKIDSVRLGSYFYKYINLEYVDYNEFDEEQILIYRKLVRQEIIGNSNLYKEFIIKSANSTTYILTNGYKSGGTHLDWVYYIELNNKITKIRRITFKKDCINIYKSCQLVIRKLQEKEFVYGNVYSLVKYANQECEKITN